MKKPPQIQIGIANPCSEDWNRMTPCEQGRFCSHCKKDVIDFTTWSDAALYNFFAKRPQNVCGRLLVSQTQRAIHIPPQPHSTLYRIVVAMGLSLLAVQPLSAQNKPPLNADSVWVATTGQEDQKPLATGELRGKVADEHKEPLLSATIQVFRDGKMVGGNITDFDGDYIVKPLEPGYYDVLCTFMGYDSLMFTRVIVLPSSATMQNFNLTRRGRYIDQTIVVGGIGYYGGARNYFNAPERISDKKLQKERERKERKAARKNKRND